MHAPSSEALQQRTTSETTDLHQPPPHTTSSGPHAQETGEKLPGACWPHAEQEAPPRPWLDTTRLDEANDHHGRARDEKKLAEGHRSSSKENRKFYTASHNLRQKTLQMTTSFYQ
jgi:hypothetical protein